MLSDTMSGVSSDETNVAAIRGGSTWQWHWINHTSTCVQLVLRNKKRGLGAKGGDRGRKERRRKHSSGLRKGEAENRPVGISRGEFWPAGWCDEEWAGFRVFPARFPIDTNGHPWPRNITFFLFYYTRTNGSSVSKGHMLASTLSHTFHSRVHRDAAAVFSLHIVRHWTLWLKTKRKQ